jgi:hypothetical protein
MKKITQLYQRHCLKFMWLCPWVVAIAGFVIMNALLFRFCLQPAEAEVAQLTQTLDLAAKKPYFKSILDQSDALLRQFESEKMWSPDFITMMENLQQSASAHNTSIEQVQKVNPDVKTTNAAGKVLENQAVHIRAHGTYARLVSWIQDLESRPNIHIQNFSIHEPLKDESQSLLKITLEVLLKP